MLGSRVDHRRGALWLLGATVLLCIPTDTRGQPAGSEEPSVASPPQGLPSALDVRRQGASARGEEEPNAVSVLPGPPPAPPWSEPAPEADRRRRARVVARLGKSVEITVGQLEAHLANYTSEQLASGTPWELRERALEELVQQAALALVAERRGLAEDPAVRSARSQRLRGLLLARDLHVGRFWQDGSPEGVSRGWQRRQAAVEALLERLWKSHVSDLDEAAAERVRVRLPERRNPERFGTREPGMPGSAQVLDVQVERFELVEPDPQGEEGP